VPILFLRYRDPVYMEERSPAGFDPYHSYVRWFLTLASTLLLPHTHSAPSSLACIV
jgi:hypothetical protein